MPRLRKLPLITLVCAALVLAVPLAWGEALAQTSSVPSQLEREFWDATRQIDSVAAYQAYLNRFPDGFFAPLASAAIKKAGSTVPSAIQASPRPTEAHGESPSNAANAQFSAARIAGPTRSSAITQQVGDVFRGPGPITVGWSGARKQIVVPGGEWVLLAAEDSQSPIVTRNLYGSYTPPVSFTTLLLARLEGRMVRSFLIARFNSKAGNYPRLTWVDAIDCESPPASASFAWRSRGFLTTQCVVASLHPQKSVAKTFSGTLWEEALQKLADGGGALPSSSFLVTDLFYTGDASNYLHASRIDFGVSSGDGASDLPNSALDLSLQGRERWAEAYSDLAVSGYRNKLAEKELDAGGSPTIDAVLLPD